MSPGDRTALYRFYNGDDELLYIGISNDPDFRWKAHRYGSARKGWPQEAARRTVEWHNSRPLALKAEADAIKAEHPRYNGKHNYDDAPFDSSTWPRVTARSKVPAIAGLMRSEISSGRWAPGQRIPSLRTLGGAVGVSIRIVSRASVLLQGEGLLNFRPGHGLFVIEHPQTRPKLPHNWPHHYGFPG